MATSYYLLENGTDRYAAENGDLFITENSTTAYNETGTVTSVSASSGSALVNNPGSGSSVSVSASSLTQPLVNLAGSGANTSVSASALSAALVGLAASGSATCNSAASGSALVNNPATSEASNASAVSVSDPLVALAADGSVDVVSAQSGEALVDLAGGGEVVALCSIEGDATVGEAAPEQTASAAGPIKKGRKKSDSKGEFYTSKQVIQQVIAALQKKKKILKVQGFVSVELPARSASVLNLTNRGLPRLELRATHSATRMAGMTATRGIVSNEDELEQIAALLALN